MPKRGARKIRQPLGDLSDATSLAYLHAAFLEHSRSLGYRDGSIANRDRYVRTFILWAQERGILRASEVSRPILERYQRYLLHYRRQSGEPLSFQSQYNYLSPVRMFFKWLARQHHILYNPAAELDMPRVDRRLPKCVLTAPEAEAVLACPPLSSLVGLRDRAILETLYSCGLRRTELIRLQLWDLDTQRRTLMLRFCKGRRDRLVPIGSRAALWLAKYLAEVRPQLACDPHEHTLFLTSSGLPMVADHLTHLVRDYVEAANIGKHGSCHLFRHTMATLMLEGGADTRFIQQMLGHASLSTTQIYTQVSVLQLQQIHAATHPAEAGTARAAVLRHQEAEALLASLDDEDEQDQD